MGCGLSGCVRDPVPGDAHDDAIETARPGIGLAGWVRGDESVADGARAGGAGVRAGSYDRRGVRAVHVLDVARSEDFASYEQRPYLLGFFHCGARWNPALF